MSVLSFSILWCIGAVVFWRAEQSEQGLTYFQALYFCYISLLTIGYGDITPKSNAGRAFFLVWSLIAVPTMTILISDMGETVVEPFKRGTFKLADFTVLPKAGAWRDWLEGHPKILHWLERRKEAREKRKRIRRGMPFAGPSDAYNDEQDLETPGDRLAPSIDALAAEAEQDTRTTKNLTYEKLARRLATAIRNVAADLKSDTERHYTYEEWVELTRLIRFTSESTAEAREEEEEMGMVEWDWIGEDSPMMSGQSEPEFVLERLCESLKRYVKKNERVRTKSRVENPNIMSADEEDMLRREEREATEALDLAGDEEGQLKKSWALVQKKDEEEPPPPDESSADLGTPYDRISRDDFAERNVGPMDEEEEDIAPENPIHHWKTAPT